MAFAYYIADATSRFSLWTDADGYAVNSVAHSPTGNLFATGSSDLCARIWRYVLIGHISLLYRPFVHLNSTFLPISLSFWGRSADRSLGLVPPPTPWQPEAS